MSVTARATLPAHVRVDDVAKVLGALAGAYVYHYHSPDFEVSWAECDSAKVVSTSVPEMVFIVIDGELHVNYHFEADTGTGERLVTAYHSRRNVDLLRGLVGFFGGALDANDCDSVACDTYVHVTDAVWSVPRSPSDGDEWDRFQAAILAVKAV